MKTLILGAGGVGGYLGARLLCAEASEVTLVARGEHLAAIRERGLHIIEDDESYTVHPDYAVDDPSPLGIYDLIFVTVKSTSLEKSLPLISKNIGPDTVIIPLLNGVDHDRYIHKYYPEADVLDGCIYILSNIVEPGVIRKKGKIFNLCWGRKGFDPEVYRPIAELFDRAGLRHKATPAIEYEVWRKFLFISPMAALTTLYDIPMDRVIAEHKKEFVGMLGELVSLAQARGISLGAKETEQTLQRAHKTQPGAKTSMQLDREQGKETEVETLVGHVVREAERLGVPSPIYRRVYEALKEESQ